MKARLRWPCSVAVSTVSVHSADRRRRPHRCRCCEQEWGKMALPALQQHAYPADPGSPADGQRDDILPGPDAAKRRADDPRRLRRVKDSREQLKRRTRARGASSATIDTTASNSSSAGRSYTVANVHNGVIYLRCVLTFEPCTALYCTLQYSIPPATGHRPPATSYQLHVGAARRCVALPWLRFVASPRGRSHDERRAERTVVRSSFQRRSCPIHTPKP